MTIDEILECLERRRIRATYGAVADVLNTANGTSYIARGVSVLLGERRPRASWVVSSQDLEPTDYSPQEYSFTGSARAEISLKGQGSWIHDRSWFD